MRTTINLDDDLVRKAQTLTGTKERSVLVRRGLEALIAQESARRLAKLGGSDSTATSAPRSRAS